MGFDGVNELVSFDYKQNGKTVKAAATADRNGFFYVLNRENGDFIRGFPFVDKQTWASGLDKNGRPIISIVIDQATLVHQKMVKKVVQL